MANAISLSRFPLLILIVILLYNPDPTWKLVSVFLLVLLILLDSLDGLVARARNEVSLMGSVIDIMVDRSVELVLWVVYTDLGLIPVAIPIICIIRGTVVDSLRNMRVSEGTAPFKTMQTKLGRWLVGSPAMRTSYAVSKLLSFMVLALTNALFAYSLQGKVAPQTPQTWLVVGNVLAWISVAFCLARGLPVIVETIQQARTIPKNQE